MSGEKTLRMALVGGGMFGGDVVLRSIEDLERCGLGPYLGRIGLDHRARAVGSLEPRLAAIGTRTEATASRLARTYRERIPGAAPVPYHGEKPWEEILARHEIDMLFVATPDPLHF
jgi:predicted dehydrogenase